MDFKETVYLLSERIRTQKDSVGTEEATKTAFVLPMIKALGYDIFNPLEVVPEMDCDLIRSKGEKIDYAILKDGGEPIILIECKDAKQNLDLHSTQLQKYFVASKSRFGVLTNGIEWRFYTDIDRTNIMDETPFLVINMLNPSDSLLEQLKKFHKSNFNEEEAFGNANELKYVNEIKAILQQDMAMPSAAFAEYFARQVYRGRTNKAVIKEFIPLVKKSLSSVISDIIQDRLTSAIKTEEQQIEVIEKEETPEIKEETNIALTKEELDALAILKKILSEKYNLSELFYKKLKGYLLVYNPKEYWWICRLSFKPYAKSVFFPDETYSGNYKRISLSSIEDLYNLKEQIHTSMQISIIRRERWYSLHKKSTI